MAINTKSLDEKIEDLNYQIKKIDGHTLAGNIGNRLYGLGHIGFQLFLYYASNKSPFALLYLPLTIDSIADVFTGKHHTLIFKLTKVHPKYELEKLEKQKELNKNN